MLQANPENKRLTSQFWRIPLLLLLWAVLLRYPAFGDPLIGDDPDWYLYVGGQMLHGYWPYVDLWDRKPVGLFALYAPFNLFGEYRFWAYQIGATLFAWATSSLLYRLGTKFTSAKGAFAAALLYCPLLSFFGGYGGREAVFYNLLLLLAFALSLFRWDKIKDSAPALFNTGAQSMILFGLAIELKPSVFLEGIYLGCVLLWLTWQQRKSFLQLLSHGLAWISLALCPTLIVMGIYALHGDWHEWVFANLVSIFHQTRHASLALTLFWSGLLALLILAAALSFSGLQSRTQKESFSRQQTVFFYLLGWAIASALMITWMTAKAGTLVTFALPFSLCCLFLWESGKKGKIFFACLLFAATIAGEARLYLYLSSPAEIAHYWAMQKEISQNPAPNCLFVYGGNEIQDITPETADCHLTKFLYSNHLGRPEEQGALGLENENAEVECILNQKPTWIFVGYPILQPKKNTPAKLLAQYQTVQKALEHDYQLATTESKNTNGTGLYKHR
ncbi:hypothetical protein FAI40_03755 [Acetobacteraceae bacterium]|nr:hypothetical protein FAI40_03755 [Acetobacteraceae bacterium]